MWGDDSSEFFSSLLYLLIVMEAKKINLNKMDFRR